MASGHYIEKCKHGLVLSQCRCPGPRTEYIIECPDECGPDGEDYGDLLDAVSWAYHKLLAFGVGSNERDAMMLDRLKLYIEAGD